MKIPLAGRFLCVPLLEDGGGDNLDGEVVVLCCCVAGTLGFGICGLEVIGLLFPDVRARNLASLASFSLRIAAVRATSLKLDLFDGAKMTGRLEEV